MLPSPSYGTKVRIGEAVSYLPCETWKISSELDCAAPLNGKGMRRRVDENSSFDAPATSSLPST